mmetsp:Transcript_18951/g.38513  ORF Transcript_18951/g.38513 Transcript_18951/m.38513 type:complete len:95 (+) Transcript_18951:451-735(+)
MPRESEFQRDHGSFLHSTDLIPRLLVASPFDNDGNLRRLRTKYMDIRRIVLAWRDFRSGELFIRNALIAGFRIFFPNSCKLTARFLSSPFPRPS